jgi:hypothetical protein
VKHELEILSTDEGMQIDSSDEQYENADSPKDDIVQPEANLRFESC